MFHDFVFNGAVVAVLAVVFDFTIDVRVLWENFARKEFLRKGKSLDFRNSRVHELGFGVVENVIVPEEAVTRQIMRNFVAMFDQGLLVKVISYAHGPANDKVHF